MHARMACDSNGDNRLLLLRFWIQVIQKDLGVAYLSIQLKDSSGRVLLYNMRSGKVWARKRGCAPGRQCVGGGAAPVTL